MNCRIALQAIFGNRIHELFQSLPKDRSVQVVLIGAVVMAFYECAVIYTNLFLCILAFDKRVDRDAL